MSDTDTGLPDPGTVEAVERPTDPNVVMAWDQAAVNAAQAATAADLNVETVQAQADSQDHPASADDVVRAEAAASEAHKRLDIIAAAQGTTVDAINEMTQTAMQEKTAQLQQQIADWERLRATHAEFADHPEVFGFVDFGGSSLVEAEQLAHVASYDIAIQQANNKIQAIQTQADSIAKKGKKK